MVARRLRTPIRRRLPITNPRDTNGGDTTRRGACRQTLHHASIPPHCGFQPDVARVFTKCGEAMNDKDRIRIGSRRILNVLGGTAETLPLD